jgi:negative regulator of sigma E activity
MELLSAFLDGEDVDPGALADALTDPAAREVLRDFALVRSAVREDPDRPGSAFYTRMERALSTERPATGWWRRTVPIPAPALAAMLVVGVLLGTWAVRPLRVGSGPRIDRPPEPDRIIEFVEGVDWTVREGGERP